MTTSNFTACIAGLTVEVTVAVQEVVDKNGEEVLRPVHLAGTSCGLRDNSTAGTPRHSTTRRSTFPICQPVFKSMEAAASHSRSPETAATPPAL
jgi:hypothetical protein